MAGAGIAVAEVGVEREQGVVKEAGTEVVKEAEAGTVVESEAIKSISKSRVLMAALSYCSATAGA